MSSGRCGLPDLNVTLCLQAQSEVHQERGTKATQQHVMILLHCCSYVLEEPSQRGDEICVVVRVPCMLTCDCKTVLYRQCMWDMHTALHLQVWLLGRTTHSLLHQTMFSIVGQRLSLMTVGSSQFVD